MRHKVELLAPAGNRKGFYGAVHAGADAVYLGGEKFGARAYADNFTMQELHDCIRYAHIWGCRVYLTVNTLVKESEFGELTDYLAPLYECGLDGVIVQDIGVFCLIRKNFPELKLHVSTQMTLTGGYGAKLLGEMGADRVVPAREISLAEIREMKSVSGLEIETFIHGAMCYCYSGQCLFSSILGGRSGNRGRCAQPCRLPYRVERDHGVTGECYPMSLKDLCTAERIPELLEAGIDSFKIEGRMKKPEYAAGVTAYYRKAIDQYNTTGKITDEGLQDLLSLYIRSERQDGYYFRHNGRDMVTLDNPSYSGGDEELIRGIRERYIERKPVKGILVCAEFRIGQPARVTFRMERDGRILHAEVEGEAVSPALKQPVTRENIEKQLRKLGDTCFRAEKMGILLDEQAFYPLKSINELRRQAVERLEQVLIEANGFAAKRSVPRADDRPAPEAGRPEQEERKTRWHLSLRSWEQVMAVADWMRNARGADAPARIYLEADLLEQAAERNNDPILAVCRDFADRGCELVIALPYVIRMRDEAFLEQLLEIYEKYSGLFSGFLARSVDGVGFLREKAVDSGKPAVYGDAGLYAWNRETLRCMREEFGLSGFCMPYELKASEQHRLLEGSPLPCEKIIYGRIPLMLTANCIANTVDGCRGNEGAPLYYLTDRYRKKFPVFCDCRHCMNIIYNSVPLSLHGEMGKWQGKAALRLNFTMESGAETVRILQYFINGAKGAPDFGEYTTGHEKRGTE